MAPSQTAYVGRTSPDDAKPQKVGESMGMLVRGEASAVNRTCSLTVASRTVGACGTDSVTFLSVIARSRQ